MSGWWRSNRWWLAALPFAVVAMVVASGYLLKDYWWGAQPRVASATATQGQYVEVSDDHITDGLGKVRHTFQVRLDAVEPVDEVTLDSFELDAAQAPPEGTQPLRVHLDWKADPDQLMRGCEVALVDSEGRRYQPVDVNPPDGCTPPGHGGPVGAVSATDQRGTVPDGEDRPPTWSTSPEFLVPEGVDITQVLVWWTLPHHVRLDVS